MGQRAGVLQLDHMQVEVVFQHLGRGANSRGVGLEVVEGDLHLLLGHGGVPKP
ncbi:hypothetical protein D3C78_1639760 [compost metagenome]